MISNTADQIAAQRAIDAEAVGLAVEVPPLATLLDDIKAWLGQYLTVSDEQLNTITLWSAHAHVVNAFDSTIYLMVRSPEPQSGKTRVLEALELLVPSPEKADNITVAYLARAIHDQCTILLDECDAIFRKGAGEQEQMLRGVINGGFRKSGTYGRVVKTSEGMVRERFKTYGAKAMAGLKPLPDTIEDRSVVIHMKRRLKQKASKKFLYKRVVAETSPLRQGLAVWADSATVMEYLIDAEPVMPSELSERAEEGWNCLFSIAELAGDEWPERCWVASETLSVGIERESQSYGVTLLGDLKSAFEKREQESTTNLLAYLNGLEESPWGGWSKNVGLLAWEMAKLLKPYGIRPKDIRTGTTVLKGYAKAHFEDAFARYLAPEEATPATIDTKPSWKESATIEQNSANVADEPQIGNSYDVAPVAPSKPQREGEL